jgi:hypothetical protein
VEGKIGEIEKGNKNIKIDQGKREIILEKLILNDGPQKYIAQIKELQNHVNYQHDMVFKQKEK